MSWIVHSSDPLCPEEGISGGKGSSLARLTRLGARVPPFVVITAQAYREMNASGPSTNFLDQLGDALGVLDLVRGVAVRSSAIGEDSADSSYAGLYHTSLQVTGFEAVVEALKTCWASYNNAAASDYRASHGGDRPDGAMAVVIQQMVEAEWAGVCFTANPVSLALSEMVVNAIPDLGEALVSGEVNPEEIAVKVADGSVLQRRKGDSSQSLPDKIVAEVWKECRSLAEKLQFPQDIEWAWKDGQLFILQSRPITTIADVYYSRIIEPWRDDPNVDPDNPDRVWSRMMADETWVSPISPLFYNVHNLSMARLLFIAAHGHESGLPQDIFKYHLATAYADVRMIQRMYEFQPRLARIRGIVNFLPAGLQEGFRRAPWRWAGRLYRILSYEFARKRERSLFRNYKRVNTQWPDYVAKSDRWFDNDLDTLSLQQLRDHQAEVGREMAVVGPPCGIAVFHASDLHLFLTGLLDRWCRHLGSDGENLYARISAGLDDSETVRESEAIWELAERMRALGPDLVSQSQTQTWSAFRAHCANHPDGKAFITQFEAFWRAHRHLGSTYKDLIWPRWGDDIDQCFEVVKAYVVNVTERPVVVNARSASLRRNAQKEILSSLHGLFGPLRRRILQFLFHYNEIYMSVRDNHRYYVDRNWYELRRIFRSYGARLVTAGVLRARDEVFFLGTEEIEQGLTGRLNGSEAEHRIETRRRVWEATLRRQGPKFLKGWARYDDRLKDAVSDSTVPELQGIAASPGTAKGVARVIYDVRDLPAVKDGEILVTRQTDPSWTTVFGRISGLVLETGGVLSHGTSLCREYGLPCVTAVEQATVKIPNGSVIELSGSEGLIRIAAN